MLRPSRLLASIRRRPGVSAHRASRWRATGGGAIAACLALSAVAPRAGGGFNPPPVAAGAAAVEASITARDLRAALEVVAGDRLAGRGVGHPGNGLAVQYLAGRLKELGIRPAAGGYLQEVPLAAPKLGRTNRIDLLRERNQVDRRWQAGDDFFPAPGSPSGEVTAPIVYAGFGTVDAAMGRDDFGGLDVRDRIVVVHEGETAPAAGDGETADERTRRERVERLRLHDPGTIELKARAAAERGARALVIVSREQKLRNFGFFWPNAPSVRRATFRLAADRLPLPVALVGASAGAAILDLDRSVPAERAIGALRERPDERPDRAPRRLRMQIEVETTAFVAHNVLAWVEGRDPALRRQLVSVGAHLDHDGIDDEGRIYNGADDDGSGTVAVLELAEAFATLTRLGQAPRRSVLLAFWNAEEKGQLGSRHYAGHVSPPAHRVVANFNLDMIGRREDIPDTSDPRFGGFEPRPAAETESLLHVLGYSFSPDLARLVAEEAPRLGLSLAAEYDGHRSDLLRRSDQWSFLTRGVPALFLTTGLHRDYHTPDDDVEDIDFDKLERIARLAFRVAWRAAEADDLPGFEATPRLQP
jgi:hypothetical protein